MKRVFISVAILFGSFTINAQDQEKYSVDLNFDPAAIFDASAGSMFTMPYIKARYFANSNLAYRLGLGLEISSETNNSMGGSSGKEKLYIKEGRSTISFAPGFEKQMGTGKLKVYLGAELPIAIGSQTKENKTWNYGSNAAEIEKTKNGSFSFGINAVIGFDYYVFNNLYVGAELTPGFSTTKYSDTKVGGVVVDYGNSNMSFGLSSSSGLRIGVRF